VNKISGNETPQLCLKDGMNDAAFVSIFRPVISKIFERFAPQAVVLQCGADSLSGDRLGCFNLSLNGHADCVSYVKSFNVPVLVLGGGGYTMRNVARCWTHETAVLLDKKLPDELPYNAYFEYYGPDYRLHIQPSNMENVNSRKYLDGILEKLNFLLNDLESVPGIQATTLQSSMAPDTEFKEQDEDKINPDINTETKSTMVSNLFLIPSYLITSIPGKETASG